MTLDEALQTRGDYDEWNEEIRSVQKEYGEYKRRNDSLDYDDLLIYLKAALDNEEVRERISSKYRYLMVDEFQDTNGLQADIVALLAKGHGNIMAVSDDAQSMYGFRGRPPQHPRAPTVSGMPGHQLRRTIRAPSHARRGNAVLVNVPAVRKAARLRDGLKGNIRRSAP